MDYLIKGYLTTVKDVPTILTPNGDVVLDFDPSPSLFEHRVCYDETLHLIWSDH